jgi:uncharacterized protein YndB with AHSA1/START domain
MATFSITTDIAAPAARVWNVMSDVERWHEWTPSVSHIRRFGKGPLGVGVRAIVRQPKFPPALWRVSDLQAGRAFTWISAAPGLRVIGRHSVEPSAAGSRATLSLEYRGALSALFARFTRRTTEQYLAFEAAGLRRRSEDEEYHV